jgi:hypothetical protein
MFLKRGYSFFTWETLSLQDNCNSMYNNVPVCLPVTLNSLATADNIFENLCCSSGVPRGYKGHKLFCGMGDDDHSSDGSG